MQGGSRQLKEIDQTGFITEARHTERQTDRERALPKRRRDREGDEER